MDTKQKLIAVDLDRTILPNGAQEESPGAREVFARLCAREDITLAYVSGRHIELIDEAIKDYSIPIPDFAVADVGTSIYQSAAVSWNHLASWHEEIASDWGEVTRGDLEKLLSESAELRLQEDERQKKYKLCYYTDEATPFASLEKKIAEKLNEVGVKASVICSVDEIEKCGLVDIVPERATKLHAVRFLMGLLEVDVTHSMFGGDSGNDLPALCSELQAVLVANARDEIKERAQLDAQKLGVEDTLYIAEGGFLGMNGNYSAGVLEGVGHYFPELKAWIESQ